MWKPFEEVHPIYFFGMIFLTSFIEVVLFILMLVICPLIFRFLTEGLTQFTPIPVVML